MKIKLYASGKSNNDLAHYISPYPPYTFRVFIPVEEEQYRKTYRTFNERRCVYEKAINSRQCTCQRSQRFNLADREGVACQSQQSHQRCSTLLILMRQNASFALKLADHDGSPLPHAKEMKVQMGGLLGLQQLAFAEKHNMTSVDNVDDIIQQAIKLFNKLEDIPFNEVVKSITQFKGRPRRSDKK